ncbi:MAG: hypothetical protein GY953_25695, partial [bacterium]|nr:hypothetical protein [bacterium]
DFGWDFLRLVPPMTDKRDAEHEDLKRLLRVGASQFGKVWRLEPISSFVRLAVLGLIVLGAGWGVAALAPDLPARIWSLWPWLVGLPAGLLAALIVYKVIANQVTLGHFFVRHAVSSTVFSVVVLLLWPVAWTHLLLFDRRYVAYGRIE